MTGYDERIMLYFSELAGKKIIAAGGKHLGMLTDFYFLGADQPLITKVSIKNKDEIFCLPITNIKTINSAIVVSADHKTVTPAENELSIRTHLLDQQIIDIKGNKVIRVNDVAIQQKPYYVVAGVDVGIMGIARWFNGEQILNSILSRVGKSVTSDFLSWDDIQPVELSSGKVVLKHEETKLTRLAPEDLADHLERLSVKNLSKVLDILPTEYETDVIENLNVSRQRALFRTIKVEQAADILSRIDADEAADILLTLSHKRRDVILSQLPQETRDPIDYLMNLSKTDIGDLATNEFAKADPEETAGAVKARLKKTAEDYAHLTYVYVVNKKGMLVGVFNLQELLQQNNDTPVYKFMVPNIVVISLSTPKEIALKKMIKYKIYALPVISEKRHILGIVALDDLLAEMEDTLV